MNIKLEFIRLKNFKGVVGEKQYDFEEGRNRVFGRNRSGKTTMYDAFLWVLFNKNSEGASTFGIKPRDKEGNDLVPNQDYEVELGLEIDGSYYSVLKRLNEVRSRARGTHEELSHKTSYYINGHKMSAGDYKKWVEENIMPENLFRAITNTRYFVSLKPDAQRSVLIDMVGLTPTESVLANNEKLLHFYNSLSDTDKDLVAYREHLSYQMKGIIKDLELIPERIKEQSNTLSQYMGMNLSFARIEAEIKSIEVEIEKIDKQMLDASEQVKVQAAEQTKALQAKYKEINDLKAKAIAIENQYQQKNLRLTRDRKAQLNDIEDDMTKAERALNNTKNDIERLDSAVELHNANKQTFNEDYNRLMDKLDAFDEETFQFDERSRYCPTCGQLLPDADIQKAYARLQEEWNTRHAEAGKRLHEEEERMNVRAEKLNKLTQEYKDKAEQLAKALNNQHTAYDIVKANFDAVKKQTIEQEDYHNDEQWKAIMADVQTKEQEAEQMSHTTIPSYTGESELLTRKHTLNAERDELKQKMFYREAIESTNKRIEELETQEKKLNEQLSELQGKDDMAQDINNAIVEDLETRVNKLFSFVQFKMFTKFLNGNIEPTCVCTVNGQPFADVNYADKINAGIDIINTISKYRNAYAPCFIDNAESINEVREMQCQQILLTVSENDTIVVNP